MSDNHDDPHQQNFETVMAMLEEIRQRAEKEEECAAKNAGGSTWQERPGVPEHSGVVSILGERGTGKTTLMRQIVEELRSNKHDLVIGPITPMDFRETHSLFSYVLAMLHDRLSSDKQKNSEPCPTKNRPEWECDLQEMRNYVARTIPLSVDALVRSGKPGEDFAYHYTSIQDKHLKAKQKYPTLVTQILDRHNSQSEKTGLLIVVMDDCDLFPDLIRIVLDDIQRMCESPRVAVLFTSNEAALFRAVGEKLLDKKEMTTIQYMDKTGLSSTEHLVEETTLYIHKVCPISQTVRMDRHTDYLNRINFKPLLNDPNLADFKLNNKLQPRPSLYKLMTRIPFAGTIHPPIPNLASLFVWSDSFDQEQSDRRQDYLFTPFCALLPKTPRALFIFYQELARFYHLHWFPTGEERKTNNREEKLIKLLMNIFLYGTLPIQRKWMDDRLSWWYANSRNNLKIDGDQTRWETQFNPNDLLSFQINQEVGQITEHVAGNFKGIQIQVCYFRPCGIVLDESTNQEVVRSDARQTALFMELIQTVSEASGFTTQTVSTLPPATLAPPNNMTEGGQVAAPLRSDCFITFPFWVEGALPSYPAFYLYRRIWNDHVTELIRFRKTLDTQLANEEKNQAMLDYLVILHLHLVALCIGLHYNKSDDFNNQAKLLIVTQIGTIEDALKERKDRFEECVKTYVKIKTDQKVIAAHATFYLACTLFSSTPMASYETTQWIKETLLTPLGERERAYRAALFHQIWHIISAGQYLPLLATRPEGKALLTGIQYILNTLQNSPDSFETSYNWEFPVQSSLAWWRNRRNAGFPNIQDTLSSDMDDRKQPTAIAYILEDSEWEIKEPVDRKTQMSSPQGQEAFDQLIAHDQMLMAGKNVRGMGDPATLLKFVQQISQKWSQYNKDDQKIILTLIGNCAVELEKALALEEAKEIYALLPDLLGMNQNDSVWLQYAHYVIKLGEYSDAKDIVYSGKHLTSYNNFNALKIVMKLEVIQKIAQKLEPYEISKELPTKMLDLFKETDYNLSNSIGFWHMVIIDTIQRQSTFNDDEKLMQSWNVWQIWWQAITIPTEKKKTYYNIRKCVALCCLATFLLNARMRTQYSEYAKTIAKDLFIMLQKNYKNEIFKNKITHIQYNTAKMFILDNENKIALSLLVDSYEFRSSLTEFHLFFSDTLRSFNQPSLAERVRQGDAIEWEQEPDIKAWRNAGNEKLAAILQGTTSTEASLLKSLYAILGRLSFAERVALNKTLRKDAPVT